MQTNFSLVQLADADNRQAERILRSCVHCGMCLSACPTYGLLGDERDSPRGRIYLIKTMLEEGKAGEETIRHLDRCLTCLACESVCPSHVDYRHLIDIGRAKAETLYRRPWWEKAKKWLLVSLLSRPTLLSPLLRLANKIAFLGFFFPWLKSIPQIPSQAERKKTGQATEVKGATAKVMLLSGCVQQVLRPEINQAAKELLASLGVEVIESNTACCGALAHHLGLGDKAKSQANILERELHRSGATFLLSTTSGCASVMKDFLPIMEVGQYLLKFSEKIIGEPKDIRVGYHTPCSLRHGLHLADVPRQLLEQAGFSLIDIPEQSLCCGSAGTYHLLQPALAEPLRDRKRQAIEAIAPDILASANIGCLEQMRPAPGLHYVELLNWALTGKRPPLLHR